MKVTRIIMVMLYMLVSLTAFARGENDTQSKVTKNNLTKVRILLKWAHDTNYIGAYVARDRGFFLEKDLDVSIQIGGQNVELLVGNGKAEFGYSYQEGVTLARSSSSSIPIVAIAAVIQHNTTGFAGLRSSGIKTPKDFEGKKYSSFGSDMEKPTLDDVMSAFGGDVKKVTFVPGGGDYFFKSIQSNLFDFAWIFEAWEVVAAQEKNIDLFYIPLVKINPVFDYYTPVIISSEKYLIKNRDIAMRFMSALKKGYEWSVKNPKESAIIFHKTEPALASLDKNLLIKSAEFLASKFIDDAPSWGVMKQEPWDNYTKWLQEKGFVDKSFSTQGAFTNDFVMQE